MFLDKTIAFDFKCFTTFNEKIKSLTDLVDPFFFETKLKNFLLIGFKSFLNDKKLLSDEVASTASLIAKDKKIRKIVYGFQLKCAYNPPKKYAGSCLDGRDICSVIVPDADVKLFITANLKTRALRRYKELKAKNKNISYQEVLKSVKKRDKSDKNRKISPLKKTKDSILLNTSNLSIRRCFLKIKKIIDRKIIT